MFPSNPAPESDVESIFNSLHLIQDRTLISRNFERKHIGVIIELIRNNKTPSPKNHKIIIKEMLDQMTA